MIVRCSDGLALDGRNSLSANYQRDIQLGAGLTPEFDLQRGSLRRTAYIGLDCLIANASCGMHRASMLIAHDSTQSSFNSCIAYRSK